MIFKRSAAERGVETSRREATGPAPQQVGRIEGYVDVVGDGRIIGWALDLDNPARKLLIEITAGDRSAAVLADLDRPDLRAAGKGDGFCGFDAVFAFDEAGTSPVHVRDASTGTDLTGSPFDPDPAHLLTSPLNRSRLERLRWEAQRTSLALKGARR